jgi:hypothetical protein
MIAIVASNDHLTASSQAIAVILRRRQTVGYNRRFERHNRPPITQGINQF